MQNEIHDKIHAEVKRLLAENGDAAPLANSDEIFSNGRLSSFAMMTLVMFLEQEFGLDFGSIDFDVSLVDSVNDIAALVDQNTRSS